MRGEVMNNLLENFEVALKDIQYLSPKVNQGITLILVIDGEIEIETDQRFYKLQEQDLLLINRNQLYEVKGNASNGVILLNISDAFFDEYYEEYRNSRFECYSQEIDMGREGMLNNIRKYLIKIMISYYRKDESYKIEIQSYLCEILLNLIRGFKKKGSPSEKLDVTDDRLTQIIDYMEKNYQYPITLEEMAKKTYLSTAYLSRYFKQKMGMGFSRYLMNIRLKHSIKELLYTDHTIAQISMNNGFPNTKSFTTLFKEEYGVTPHHYSQGCLL
jgi:AraC-like DNA-binding protein